MIENTSRMDTPVAGRRRGRWVLAAVTVVALVSLGAIWVLPALSDWGAARQSVDRGLLRFAEVTRGDLVHDIAVQGRVVAPARPTLFSPATGIASVLVQEGETVAAGEVLVRVDSPELENRLKLEEATRASLRSALGRQALLGRRTKLENAQAIDLLEVRVAAARRALARNEEMLELGIVNVKELETSRDELTKSKLELAHAKQSAVLSGDMLDFEARDAAMAVERQDLVIEDLLRQLRELEVLSPFGGLVATVEIQDRDAVVSGQPLIGVVDLEALEVDVNIPETFADEVGPGVQAVMTIDGEQHLGLVTRVAPEVRSGQVTGRVSFVDAMPERLRQNQRVSTRLVLDRRSDVLKLPRGPFLESGGGKLVYVVDERSAHLRHVELGVISVTEVEILDGLSEHETVVLSDVGRFEGAETLLLTH